ncbi:hypothetical protein [Cohnella thailandensis]|uniref:YtkA-like domain-containing protein n=1 Tax=Cohnella thailandensis TaxID=557557 RepID=A0A841T4P4_9BACL|nr:hypothetical protein [Cohnella thailandensis]MBB6637050.1 hypothetical protein [Cohnella thailandensis]MBP1973063.1 hypothetical protein [Cohnella thailandensis]
MPQTNKPISIRWAAIPICLLLLTLMLVGCTSSSSTSLKSSEVTLVTDPSAPIANQPTQFTVQIDNADYAAMNAVVQLQINSNRSLPELLDTTREGEAYTVAYEFRSAGEYTVTVHLSYDEDHYAFAKKLSVQ